MTLPAARGAAIPDTQTPSAPPPSTQPATAVEDLSAKIKTAIALLEEKKYVEAVRLLAEPKVIMKMEDHPGGLEKEAPKKLSTGKGAKLLDALKEIQNQQAEISQDGKCATFKFRLEAQDLPEIRFDLVDGKWYLR